jgi:hypothetical protein
MTIQAVSISHTQVSGGTVRAAHGRTIDEPHDDDDEGELAAGRGWWQQLATYS